MISLVIETRDGSPRAISVAPGTTLMEAIRDNGFDELLALCGGCCSCAECHVIVAADFRDRLPPVAADEDDLLDAVERRDAGSRLSCQIPLSPALDGLRVRIATSG